MHNILKSSKCPKFLQFSAFEAMILLNSISNPNNAYDEIVNKKDQLLDVCNKAFEHLLSP